MTPTEHLAHWRTTEKERIRHEQQTRFQRLLNEYDPPEYSVAVLAELRIDERYQRARNEAKVAALRDKFHPNACQPLAVSLRADGTQYLVDGQHRAAAVTDLGGKSWPALIYRNLTLPLEAAMWAEMNTRQTKPRPPDRFRAALEYREPEAVSIDRLVRSCGYRLCIRRHARKVSGDQIDAIEAILSIYRRSREAGLRDVLTLVRIAWPDSDETQRTARLVLVGLATFLAGTYAPRIEFDRAAHVIGRFTPSVWIAKTRGVTSGESPEKIFAERIRAAYNKGTPRGKRL